MHIVSITFDDGFSASCQKIASIYEKFGLSANFNIIASGHLHNYEPADVYHSGWKRGDFGLWNELQSRGHEIMPHGWRHADKSKLPFTEARDLILRCLDFFAKELNGFIPEQAIFNFPYNRATPELERWLACVVKAYRIDGEGINALPHTGQTRLTTTAFGPDSCDEHLEGLVNDLLSRPEGWLVYCAHGVDGEGWGPMSSGFLERLLDRLVQIETVKVLPPGRALKLAEQLF